MAFTYKGLQATLTRRKVALEEVDRNLENIRSQSPRFIPVYGRLTQSGDIVTVDFAGTCDGKEFPGCAAKGQNIRLGSGTCIPGFEDGLTNQSVGQNFDVFVILPQLPGAPELSGREARFNCFIHEIRQQGAYELDDVFAREVGGCETLDEMRRTMATYLQAYADRQAELEVQDDLLRQAADALDVTPTDAQVNASLEAILAESFAPLRSQGLTPEDYCKFMGKTLEEIREDYRPEAVIRCRIDAAVQQIAKLEGLCVTQEDLDAVKQQSGEDDEVTIGRLLLQQKVAELLYEAATIQEVIQ